MTVALALILGHAISLAINCAVLLFIAPRPRPLAALRRRQETP